MDFDDLYGEKEWELSQPHHTVVVIYDIMDNKRRVRMAKHLLGYGFRVQKSAFECVITDNKYRQLLRELDQMAQPDDLLRVYRLNSANEVTVWGNVGRLEAEAFYLF